MGIKSIIQKSPLLKVFSFCAYQYNTLAGNYKIKGKGNKVICENGSVLWNCKIKITGHNNTITLGKSATFRNVSFTITGSSSSISIAEKVKFYESGQFLIEGDNGSISIAGKTTFGSAKLFVGEGNTAIAIGSDCMFSRNVRVNTSDFHSILEQDTLKRINPPKSVTIKDHVWVGNGANIAKGTEIGPDCIVASAAYVSGKKYAPNTVIAGIPAKELKNGVTWSREKLAY